MISEGADSVERDAKSRVPVATGKLRDAIHMDDEQDEGTYVIGGDTEAWYGHLVEYGTVRTSPRPFLVPALEENRAEIVGCGSGLVEAAVDGTLATYVAPCTASCASTALDQLCSARHAPGYTKSIYHGIAPEGAGFPYVLFHKQSRNARRERSDASRRARHRRLAGQRRRRPGLRRSRPRTVSGRGRS